MYKLEYFKRGSGICGDDFKNNTKVASINLDHVVFITELSEFHLPFSGSYKGNYAIVKVTTGDTFYIKEDSFIRLNLKVSSSTK